MRFGCVLAFFHVNFLPKEVFWDNFLKKNREHWPTIYCSLTALWMRFGCALVLFHFNFLSQRGFFRTKFGRFFWEHWPKISKNLLQLDCALDAFWLCFGALSFQFPSQRGLLEQILKIFSGQLAKHLLQFDYALDAFWLRFGVFSLKFPSQKCFLGQNLEEFVGKFAKNLLQFDCSLVAISLQFANCNQSAMQTPEKHCTLIAVCKLQ